MSLALDRVAAIYANICDRVGYRGKTAVGIGSVDLGDPDEVLGDVKAGDGDASGQVARLSCGEVGGLRVSAVLLSAIIVSAVSETPSATNDGGEEIRAATVWCRE